MNSIATPILFNQSLPEVVEKRQVPSDGSEVMFLHFEV